MNDRTNADVVSLGSLNVDHTTRISSSELEEMEDEIPEFPSAGETNKIENWRLPERLRRLDYTVTLGGKGANQSVASARAGSETAFLGKVGADDGEEALSELSDRGVDTEAVGTADTETGKAYVFVDRRGENRIVVVEGANGRVDEDYVDSHYETVRNAEYLMLQNEIPGETTDHLLSRLDDDPDRPKVVFDPAPPEGTAELLGHPCVDFTTPNEHELGVIEESLDEISATVIQTLGGKGVVVVDDGEKRFRPPDVDPVDTTGAGDTFNGYLTSGLQRGMSLEEAVEYAVTAASLSTENEGAQTSIPHAERVERFIEENEG